LFDLRYHIANNLSKPGCLGCAYPLQAEPFWLKTEVLHHQYDGVGSGFCFLITFQVMTFADVSATHQDSISALGQCIYYQAGMHHPGAHNPDDPYVGRILDSGHAGQIGASIGTPVTAEGYD
jgi:hypothetical protein